MMMMMMNIDDEIDEVADDAAASDPTTKPQQPRDLLLVADHDGKRWYCSKTQAYLICVSLLF